MSQGSVKFFKNLKSSKDVHAQFFSKPATTFSANIEIDLYYNGQRISVYRNPKCSKRECFYSDIELKIIFENDARESPKYEFACRICQTRIVINTFVLDSVMQLALEQANKMNSKTTLKIILEKDGSWKPHPDSSDNIIASLQPSEFLSNPLPDIENFSLEDYKRLMQLYTNEWSKDNDFSDTAIVYLGIKLKFQDVYSIAFSSEITPDLMRFLMLFFENQNQKSSAKWKIHYVAINVSRFDEVSSEGVFQYLEGFEQTLGFNEFLRKDIIILVYLFEKMWTLVIYRVQEKSIIALNYFHLAQSQMLTKYLLATVLGLRNPSLKIIPSFEIEKVNELPSSGNAIFFFLHDLILDKNFTRMVSVNKEAVKMIRSQAESIKWLTLKATENFISPKVPSKRSIQRKPSSVRQITQPSRQPSLIVRQPSELQTQSKVNTEPKPVSVQQVREPQPSPRIMPYQSTSRSIPPPQSQASTIRTAQIVQMEPKAATPIQQYRPSYEPRQSVSPLVTQKMSDRRSMVKTPVEENMVQLSKDELIGLLEKVRENVMYEVNNPKEDLAKKYVNQIDNFNVRTDKIDKTMPFTMQNQSILMTGADMYDILDKFKSDVRREVAHDMKNGINYIDPQIEKEEAEKNFQGFQQILWYYYQYQPDMYKQLIDEYNHRFHNQLLEKMGLSEILSGNKMQPQLQPRDSQKRMPRDSMINDFNTSSMMQRSNQRASQPNNNVYRNSIANNSIDNTYRSSFLGSNDNSRHNDHGYRNSILNNPNQNNRQSMLGNSNQLNGSRQSGFNSNNMSDSMLRYQPDNQYRNQGSNSRGY